MMPDVVLSPYQFSPPVARFAAPAGSTSTSTVSTAPSDVVVLNGVGQAIDPQYSIETMGTPVDKKKVWMASLGLALALGGAVAGAAIATAGRSPQPVPTATTQTTPAPQRTDIHLPAPPVVPRTILQEEAPVQQPVAGTEAPAAQKAATGTHGTQASTQKRTSRTRQGSHHVPNSDAKKQNSGAQRDQSVQRDTTPLNDVGRNTHKLVDTGGKVGKKIGRGFKSFGKKVAKPFKSGASQVKDGWNMAGDHKK